MDLGILEKDFWQMTLAELDRYIASKKRVMEAQERKQASFDYILADLIGRSMARVYNSSNKMPTIDKVYPSLFSSEEVQISKAQLQKQRFLAGLQQFAQSYNKEFEEMAKDNDE